MQLIARDNDASVPSTMTVTTEKLDFSLNNSFSIVTIENSEIRVDGYKRVSDKNL